MHLLRSAVPDGENVRRHRFYLLPLNVKLNELLLGHFITSANQVVSLLSVCLFDLLFVCCFVRQ